MTVWCDHTLTIWPRCVYVMSQKIDTFDMADSPIMSHKQAGRRARRQHRARMCEYDQGQLKRLHPHSHTTRACTHCQQDFALHRARTSRRHDDRTVDDDDNSDEGDDDESEGVDSDDVNSASEEERERKKSKKQKRKERERDKDSAFLTRSKKKKRERGR